MSDSRYKIMKNRKTLIKYSGFAYQRRMLMKTTDNNLYNNDALRGFAQKIEFILNEWFYQVKRVKLFINYVVPPDYDQTN